MTSIGKKAVTLDSSCIIIMCITTYNSSEPTFIIQSIQHNALWADIHDKNTQESVTRHSRELKMSGENTIIIQH